MEQQGISSNKNEKNVKTDPSENPYFKKFESTGAHARKKLGSAIGGLFSKLTPALDVSIGLVLDGGKAVFNKLAEIGKRYTFDNLRTYDSHEEVLVTRRHVYAKKLGELLLQYSQSGIVELRTFATQAHPRIESVIDSAMNTGLIEKLKSEVANDNPEVPAEPLTSQGILEHLRAMLDSGEIAGEDISKLIEKNKGESGVLRERASSVTDLRTRLAA